MVNLTSTLNDLMSSLEKVVTNGEASPGKINDLIFRKLYLKCDSLFTFTGRNDLNVKTGQGAPEPSYSIWILR